MKQAVLGLALVLCVSSSAKADWLMLAESEKVQVFVDRGQLLNGVEATTVEFLLNFKEPVIIKEPVLSAINKAEFNCQKNLTRSVSVTNYAGYMASGRVTSSSQKPTKWSAIRSEGLHQVIFEIACGK
jgi:hypothetical protein